MSADTLIYISLAAILIGAWGAFGWGGTVLALGILGTMLGFSLNGQDVWAKTSPEDDRREQKKRLDRMLGKRQ